MEQSCAIIKIIILNITTKKMLSPIPSKIFQKPQVT